MGRINKIILRKVLPMAFAGEDAVAISQSSDVWMRDIVFERGANYIVTAGSGRGKSSMCSFIYGERGDYQGRIFCDDADLRGFNIARWSELRCRHIAMLPQQMRLFPELTVMENILLKNSLTGYKTVSEIVLMLERVEVGDKIHERVARLSIGQQQRVAIVRALCQPMDFLLLDEPVSHLDERCSKLVSDLIVEQANAQDAAIITTSVGYSPMIDAKKLKL